MRYWDTSVLLKLYVQESDSDRFAGLLAQPGEVIHTSEFSRLELLRAFWGKRLDGAIRAGAEKALLRRFDQEVELGRITLVSQRAEAWKQFEGVLETCYKRAQPVRLRAFDALHLATALAAKATEIVCTDTRMRAGATLLGLRLFPL